VANDPSPELLAELDALRERVARQESELDALRREAPTGATRRALFKGAGAVAGGVALASALGGQSVAAAGRAPGVDVPRGAMTISAYLTANGAQLQNDLSDDKSIPCVSLNSPAHVVIDQRTGFATGKRFYDGISIRKAMDSSTPLLAKALTNNEVIAGAFKFFRPNPSGDGTTEHFFTIELDGGRVASLEQVSPDGYSNQSGQPAPVAPFDDVTFVFQTITWRYEPGGIEHTDTWNARV
jgi:type VI secretion system secreted protein Hcp